MKISVCIALVLMMAGAGLCLWLYDVLDPSQSAWAFALQTLILYAGIFYFLLYFPLQRKLANLFHEHS